MIIEFDFNDEALFQKYKVFIQFVTREIEDIVRVSDVRGHLRWSNVGYEVLCMDLRVTNQGMPILGLVHVYTLCLLKDSKHQENISREILKNVRRMVSQI